MADIKEIEISIEVDTLQAHKAFKSIQKDQKDLQRLFDEGRISEKQLEAATKSLTQRQKELTAAVRGGGKAFRQYNNRLNQAKSGSNKFGMVSQQVGYQVGDFFVQVQSGTSALVAFGQQGTQLAGLLPGVAGAIIGVGLAVGTMLLRSFMQAKGEVKNFEEALKKANDGIDRLKTSLDEVVRIKFSDEIDRMDRSLKSLAETMIKLAKLDIFLGFQQSLNKLNDQVKSNYFGLEEMFDRWTNFSRAIKSDIGVGEAFSRTLDLEEFGFNEKVTLKVFDKFISDMNKALKGKDLDVLTNLSDAFVELAFDPSVTEQGKKFLYQINDLVFQFKELKKAEAEFKKEVASKTFSNAQEKNLNAAKRTNNQMLDMYRFIREEQQQQIKNEKIAEGYRLKAMGFGMRSLSTDESKAISGRYRLKAMGFGMRSLSTDESKAISGRYRLKAMGTEVRPQEGVSEQNIQLGRSANNRMLDMVRFIKQQQAEIEISDRNAKQGLIRNLTEYANSRLQSEANLTEQLSKQYDDRILRQQGITQGEFKADLEKANLLKETTKQFELQNKEAEDRIKLLEVELDYGQDSLELEKAILQQERWRKIEAAREAKLSEGMIHVLDMRWTREMNLLLLTRKQREEKEKLLELEEQRLDFEKKIEGFLESGFMSMIDGTKSVTDAFRSMARDVIKELYRILVVQQIVNQAKTAIQSLSGFAFPSASSSLPNYSPPTVSANGNAFNNGKIIPYANGGVVGSPTMFPMSGGKTGLMGEAGPEAILPLKRGPNGKLGVESSGGSVVVNQTINVSTGVVQTVRNEIKTLMPQIAEGAKSAVLDAKRRGGSFGSAFA